MAERGAPGFMGARNIGFASIMTKQRGLASMGQLPGLASMIGKNTNGFAQYEEAADINETRTKPHACDRRRSMLKQTSEVYPWPNAAVSMLINMKEAGTNWRKFDNVLEARARAIGRSVGLRNFQCVIISHEELHSSMDEKYSSVVHDPNPKRRARILQETLSDINGIIEDLACEEQRQAWITSDAESRQLWVPECAELGVQEGCGPHGIGMTLEDERIFAQRKSRLVTRVCTELGFNPVHFTPLQQPKIMMVDTSPLPVDGLNFNIPAVPYDIPLRVARAYGPDHQAVNVSMMV